MLENPERLNLQLNYRLDCRVVGLLVKKAELFFIWVTTLYVPQKWCKYNFGVDEELTVAFSRNVESKESVMLHSNTVK